MLRTREPTTRGIAEPPAGTISCPRCGATNAVSALNCAHCKINLAFARENPSAIERLKREGARSGRLPGPTPGQTAGDTPAPRAEPLLLPVLLLLASFAFGFCLGEAVHEFGHFLAHRAYGVDVGIRLDPFGGSRIVGGSLAPREIWGITSLAGPLLNVAAATLLFALLWRWRRPALLPLLLWGPIALVQEGVTFSLGLLTRGGDAALIVEWGVPVGIVVGAGMLFLALGVGGVCSVLPLAGMSPAASFGTTFTLLVGGLVSFMAARLVFSPLTSRVQAGENLLPLLFSLLLAAVVAALYRPMHRIIRHVPEAEPARVSRFAVAVAAALGVAMIVFQLVSFNGWGS